MLLEPLDIFLRVGMAFLTGFILGIERESHGRAAGLRTMVLVSVAAAVAAILSEQFYIGSFSGDTQSLNWHPDPGRLGAGILTGIGFLGAGVILRHGNLVRGVTTASLIWLVTVLGLCFGSGQLILGLTGLATSILAVFFLRYVEDFVKRDWYATLLVATDLDTVTVPQLREILANHAITIKSLELDHNIAAKTRTMTFSLRFKRDQSIRLPEKIIAEIGALSGIQRIDWK